MPVDGECDRGIAQDAEVEAVVSVLPDVLTANHNILSKGLLNPAWNSLRKPGCMVPETPGLQESSGLRTASEQPLLDRTRFFVEWSLQGPGIRDAQQGSGGLECGRRCLRAARVVSFSSARL